MDWQEETNHIQTKYNFLIYLVKDTELSRSEMTLTLEGRQPILSQYFSGPGISLVPVGGTADLSMRAESLHS